MREGTTAQSISTSLQTPVLHSTSALERVEVCNVFLSLFNTLSLSLFPTASFSFPPYPLPVSSLSVVPIPSLYIYFRLPFYLLHCLPVCICFSHHRSYLWLFCALLLCLSLLLPATYIFFLYSERKCSGILHSNGFNGLDKCSPIRN